MVKFQESNASLVTEPCVLILEASRKFTHRSKRTESRFYFSFDGVYYIFYFYEAGVEYRGDRCAAPWSQFNGLPQKRIEAEALVGCDTTERGEGCVKSHPLARHPCLPPSHVYEALTKETDLIPRPRRKEIKHGGCSLRKRFSRLLFVGRDASSTRGSRLEHTRPTFYPLNFCSSKRSRMFPRTERASCNCRMREKPCER